VRWCILPGGGTKIQVVNGNIGGLGSKSYLTFTTTPSTLLCKSPRGFGFFQVGFRTNKEVEWANGLSAQQASIIPELTCRNLSKLRFSSLLCGIT
jgi:hypothetical protein